MNREVGPGKKAPGAPPSPVDAGVGATPPGPTWRFTDDPGDPCALCVQWRCEVCHSHDWPGCCDWNTESEPYWPDGSVQTLVYQTVHEDCERSVLDYQADHADDADRYS